MPKRKKVDNLIKIKKRKRYCFTHGNVIYESCG